MSVSLSVTGYSSAGSKEFQKHYAAVKFCIANELSFPKETSEFFKGKLGGDDLEDIESDYILKYIENGVEVPLETYGNEFEKRLNVSEIPKEVDLIIVKMEY